MNEIKLLKKQIYLVFLLVFCFSISTLGQVVIERKNSNKESEQKQGKRKEKGAKSAQSKINTLQIEQDIFELFNKKRIEGKLKPLVWNDRISKISRNHSESMSRENFFSLKSKDGKTVKDQAYEAEIINWTNFGRMIAAGTDIKKVAETTVKRWFSSEPRRRYLMSNIWEQTGIGVFIDKNGKIYITQDFLGK